MTGSSGYCSISKNELLLIMTSHCDSLKNSEEAVISAHNRISSHGCAKQGNTIL